MIVVTGELEFHPEDAWSATCAAFDLMLETQKEAGCISYRFYADIVTPHRFHVYQEWRDEAALKAHAKTPHVALFKEKLAGFRMVSRRMKKILVKKSTLV